MDYNTITMHNNPCSYAYMQQKGTTVATAAVPVFQYSTWRIIRWVHGVASGSGIMRSHSADDDPFSPSWFGVCVTRYRLIRFVRTSVVPTDCWERLSVWFYAGLWQRRGSLRLYRSHRHCHCCCYYRRRRVYDMISYIYT